MDWRSIIWPFTSLGLALACGGSTPPDVAPENVERTVIITDPPGARIVVDAETLATVSPTEARYHRERVNGVAWPFRIHALPSHSDECPQFVLLPANGPGPDTVRFLMTRCPKSDQDLARVFSVDSVEVPPVRLRGPMPDPEYLLRSGQPGCVMVGVVIDTTGLPEPQSVEIIRATDPGFNRSATKSVLGSIFTPARVYGRKVRVHVQIPIQYVLQRDGDYGSLDWTRS